MLTYLSLFYGIWTLILHFCDESTPLQGEVPIVTLTASSSPYFDIGGSISLTCAVNKDVGIKYVYLTKNRDPYILILINNTSSCEFYKLTSADTHVYNISCEQHMTVHILMNGTDETDHNVEWSCQMSAESGMCNYPCISVSSVRTAQRVPVSSVQLTDGNGHPLITPVPVLNGSDKDFGCDTSPNGSRPRALVTWYRRFENQSPILIQNLSVSTPGMKPEVDLSINISYSTLKLMGSISYQNMYIYCEARDETNRGNFSKSREIQLNIVYPPTVQLFPNTSVFNVTEGTPNFVFLCNITDANPMPQPDDYSWFLGDTVIQGQTRSSYQLLNVGKAHDGVYQCMSKNDYGAGRTSRLHLNVQYGAVILNLSVTEGNTVNENTTATLTCLVDSNPESSITWSKQGILGSLMTDKYVHQSELTIGHADCLDTANYTCTASNGLGHPVEKTIPLYVTCHPRTDFRSPPVTKVYSMRYGKASLRYSVISLPEPTFNWTLIGDGSANLIVPDSATKYDNGLQSVLMFTNLSVNDFGFYRVIAKNVFPTSAIEVFQLIQGDVPEVPFNVTVTDVKQTSLTVQWAAGYNGGLEQTFHIMITAGDIKRSVYAPDPGYRKYGTQTIEDLMPNTKYGIYMSAYNNLGSSSMTVVFQTTLQAVGRELEVKGGANVAAIAGGIGAAVVVVVILVVLVYIWRRKASMLKNSSDEGISNSVQGRSNQTGNLYVNTSFSGDVSNTGYESLQAFKTEASLYQTLSSGDTETSDQNKDCSESMTIGSAGAGKIYMNTAITSPISDKEYESLQSNQIETNQYQVLNDCSQPINIRLSAGDNQPNPYYNVRQAAL